MKSFNKSLASKGKSIAGAARYVRKAIADGMNPDAVKAAVLKRWPKFKSDAAGLESRIKTALRLNETSAA